MYCVNLFAIVLPLSVSGQSSLADFKADATSFNPRACRHNLSVVERAPAR
jgi:hypothetical protein